MIIIEFCGTPGVGKSTLCKTITTELQGIGLVAECRENWLESIRHSLFRRIKRKGYCICCRFYRSFPSLIKKTSLSEKKNLNKWLAKIIETDYFIVSSKRKKIILFDEGIIQFITSISHENEIGNALLSAANSTRKEIISTPYLIFNCSLDTITILIELEKEIEMIGFLNIQMKNCLNSCYKRNEI